MDCVSFKIHTGLLEKEELKKKIADPEWFWFFEHKAFGKQLMVVNAP